MWWDGGWCEDDQLDAHRAQRFYPRPGRRRKRKKRIRRGVIKVRLCKCVAFGGRIGRACAIRRARQSGQRNNTMLVIDSLDSSDQSQLPFRPRPPRLGCASPPRSENLKRSNLHQPLFMFFFCPCPIISLHLRSTGIL